MAAFLALGPQAGDAGVPPANDDFPGAAIASLPFDDFLDLSAATSQPGEPQDDFCGFFDPPPPTVWYQYTPAADSLLVVTASLEGGGAPVAVWTDSDFPGGALALVECGDGFDRPTTLAFKAEAARSYYVQVSGYPGVLQGDLDFRLEEGLPPPNDDFDSAEVVKSLPFEGSVNTLTAVTDDADPVGLCSFGPMGASVWYSFTPDSDMSVQIDTAGSEFLATVSVWTQGGTGLEEQTCSADPSGFAFSKSILGARVAFLVEAGQTYWITVGSGSSFSIESGSLVVTLTEFHLPVCPQPHRSFTDPAGDGDVFEGQEFDLTSLNIAAANEYLCLEIGMTDMPQPVGSPGAFQGAVFLDVDSNPTTGAPIQPQGDCLDDWELGVEVAGSFVAGFGLLFEMFTVSDDPFKPSETFYAGLLELGTAVTVIIPADAFEEHARDGDDDGISLESSGGEVPPSARLGLAIGGLNAFLPSDCIPDEGFVSTGEQKLGDTDCDDDVDSVDSLWVLREVAGLPFTAKCIAAGDVQCDGDRDSVDALGIQRHVAALPEIAQTQPCRDIGT